jgi:hypothetical protein
MRRERLHIGERRRTRKLVILWVRLGSGLYSLFCTAWGLRCLSDANGSFLGRRNVSLTSCCLSFKSPLSVTSLTAIRNRDDEVYSVTASCWQWVMKGPAASGLTTRGVVKGTTVVGGF